MKRSLIPNFLYFFFFSITINTVLSRPQQQQSRQIPFTTSASPHSIELDPASPHSAFSVWSREKKADFLNDLSNNVADEWTLVMGNEGGDLDSMVAALTFSFYLNHLEIPQKAIALLQTEADALDLRPENKLSLKYAQMSNGHRDLLTIDELPIKPWDISHRILGLSLVDHNVPRSIWTNSTILSIIDHHEDSLTAPEANPRIIQKAACCSSLVAELVLDALEVRREKARLKRIELLKKGGHHKNKKGEEEERGDDDNEHGGELPTELVDLILRAIAIDSGGLKDKIQEVDLRSAKRLFPLSSWGIEGNKGLFSVMKSLDKELSYYKKALEDLTLRDLLRRDWKADGIPTQSKIYPEITVGFASISASMNEMILRTPEQTTPEWFAIERAWTAESQCDVSIVLNNHRDTDDSTKAREIALVVATGYGRRLNKKAGDKIFKAIVTAIESTHALGELEIWNRPDGLDLPARRKIWIHYSGEGRKTLKPIVEKAVREWRN